MKICSKCNAANTDNAVQCKDCGESILKVIAIDNKDYMEELEVSNQKKHRRKMLIHNSVLAVVGVLYIYFLVMGLRKEFMLGMIFVAILLPALAFVQIHYPRAIFVITHLLTIENIDDVELSDLYLINAKISGFLCAVASFAFVIAFYVLG